MSMSLTRPMVPSVEGRNAGGTDIAIFKLNSSGVTQWVTQQPAFNTTGNDVTPSLVASPSGTLYVTYSTNGTASGQASTGTTNIVVIKLDTNGNEIWITEQPTFNSNGTNATPTIALDSTEQIYVTYVVTGQVSGWSTVTNTSIAVFKMDHTSATVLWNYVNYNESATEVLSDPHIVVDGQDSAYVSYQAYDSTEDEYAIGVFKLSGRPPCFNKGTKILCLDSNNNEVYRPIEEIQPGTLVKTVKNGYLLVSMCGSRQMINNPDTWESCMYRMPKTGAMTDDLIVTGGHSILVPQIDPVELPTLKSYLSGKTYVLDGYYMMLAAASKSFVKLDNYDSYTYYHLVLESADEDRRYGIWRNGVLTETQSRHDFLLNTYEKMACL